MNRQNSAKVVFALMASFASIATIPASANLPSEQLIASLDRYSHSPLTSSDYSMPEMDDVYSPVRIPEKKSAIDRDLRSGLHQAVRYLKGKNPNEVVAKKGLNLPNRKLTNTLNSLLRWNGAIAPEALKYDFDLVPLAKNGTSVSKFTGYYTPIIEASHHRDETFRYPIYRSPMSGKLRLLSRKAISAGALSNKGFEIAWTNDPVGYFYMQVQGSGILKYKNGHRVSLTFDGTNEKRFGKISQYMAKKGYLNGNLGREAIQNWLYKNPSKLNYVLNQNPRYVYFKKTHKDFLTASGLPLVKGHSIAVDTNYTPFGSVVLAQVPIINSKGQTLGTEWKLLLPKDRGSDINGAARIDVYTGQGEAARLTANRLTGNHRAYVLIKRDGTQLSKNGS
jgi:membrane-bound lytic murein transglycosylase A